MKMGTKSVLFGAHAFWLHPWFVALAWSKLYGFPWDPRLWFAFVVHDLGYVGCKAMDNEEGEEHVVFGARLISLFDEDSRPTRFLDRVFGRGAPDWKRYPFRWALFCYYHSRFIAKRANESHSMLCVADKLACALEPWWLYLPRVVLTGEVKEYMANRLTRSKYAGEPISPAERAELEKESVRAWHRGMTAYTRRWVAEHRDGRVDHWTPQSA